MAMAHLANQLNGYRLTLAEIIYRLPDHPDLLQSYLWQDLDMAPRFPELHRFLDFWARNLDGPLHLVRVAHSELIKPAEFRYRDHELTLH
jgi:uncharacterized protein Usg